METSKFNILSNVEAALVATFEREWTKMIDDQMRADLHTQYPTVDIDQLLYFVHDLGRVMFIWGGEESLKLFLETMEGVSRAVVLGILIHQLLKLGIGSL